MTNDDHIALVFVDVSVMYVFFICLQKKYFVQARVGRGVQAVYEERSRIIMQCEVRVIEDCEWVECRVVNIKKESINCKKNAPSEVRTHDLLMSHYL